MRKFRETWIRCEETVIDTAGDYRMPPSVGPLKKGHVVGLVYNRYTCEKEVKLWSDFEHVLVPGGVGLSPTELEEPGNRSTYHQIQLQSP